MHGTEILNITDQETDFNTSIQDAMMTRLKNICLCVKGADCVPLLFFDPIKNVIAAAHAGWRGTLQKIASKVIENMKYYYHAQPETIYVGIGPSISCNNYEVSHELAEEFMNTFDESVICYKHSRVYLDLWKCNQIQLIESGIKLDHIECSGLCTYERSDTFYSHRHSGGKTGRFVAGLMLVG